MFADGVRFSGTWEEDCWVQVGWGGGGAGGGPLLQSRPGRVALEYAWIREVSDAEGLLGAGGRRRGGGVQQADGAGTCPGTVAWA